MNAKALLDQLLEDKKFYPAHVKLTESIGLLEALVLQQHVFYQSHSGENYYGVRKRIEREFRLSHKYQRKIENRLIKLGFLKINRKSTTSYNYYTVLTDNIEEFVSKDFKTRVSLADKAFDHPTTSREGGSDGQALGGSDGQSHLNIDNNINLNKTLFNKLNSTEDGTLCATNNKPSRLISKESPIQKSRLIDKGIPPVQTKTNPLVERTNIASGNKPIPKRTLRCIEYWNQYPELTQHKTDKHSSTIKQIVKLMGNFFEGNFLSVVSIPRTFNDSTWFSRKPTIEEFFEIVDDFVYCIKSPDIKPVCNGTRYSLLDFLQGNQYMNADSGGVPSLMLTYCFGEYQTVVPDNNPESTKKIKDIWTKHIGRFHDSPGTERAFVIASNICTMRFEEKREEEANWIPAMNDYRPEGIIRQIIIDKAEWFKKEKKPPEIMASSFFTSIIRRYDYNKRTGNMTL